MARPVSRDGKTQPARRLDRAVGPYTLVARGPDGRLRAERFNDATSYRARLLALQRQREGAVSLGEIISLLDV